jgi:K+-transporting ATPase ATPase B chain
VAERFATFVPFTAQTRMSGVDLYAEAQSPARHQGARQPQAGRSTAGGAPQSLATERRGTSHPVHSQRRGRGGGQLVKEKGAGGPKRDGQGGRDFTTGRHAAAGGRWSQGARVILLKDIVKGGIKERFAQLRKMGIARS